MPCEIEKIVVNARFLTQEITGVQRFAIEICLRLKELLGERVLFVAPSNIIQQDYAEQLCAFSFGTHSGHLWEQFDLPAYLKSIGNPLLLCLCNTAPISYKNKVATIHDVAFEAYPKTFSKSFLWAYKFLIPKIARSSRHIFTVSNFSKKEIIKYYGIQENKISVIYNAVSFLFKPIEDSRLKKEIYLLAVSSLNYRKNFIVVLKAFEKIQQRNPNINLFIVGDLNCSNFHGIDISKYKKNPNVKFLGRVSDEELVRYYSNARGFVYPSIYEGFGIPPLEAQSCECPVLVSDIPPLREVIGDSGIYCNPYSVEDVCEGMELLLTSSDLKAKGKENVKRFSWEKSAKKIMSRILQFKFS